MFTDDERDSVAKRFWAKVIKSKGKGACWLWDGAKSKAGYGILVVRQGHNVLAHRISFALKHGLDALEPKLHIAHKCHNRLCVNPAHLHQTTPGANVLESRMAGRSARGTAYPNAKINDDAVREIRKVAKDLEGECAMMLKYRCSQQIVQSVFRRRSWKHVV